MTINAVPLPFSMQKARLGTHAEFLRFANAFGGALRRYGRAAVTDHGMSESVPAVHRLLSRALDMYMGEHENRTLEKMIEDGDGLLSPDILVLSRVIEGNNDTLEIRAGAFLQERLTSSSRRL